MDNTYEAFESDLKIFFEASYTNFSLPRHHASTFTESLLCTQILGTPAGFWHYLLVYMR